MCYLFLWLLLIPTHTRRVTDEERRGEERGMEEERRDSEKLTLSLSYSNTHTKTGAKRGGGGVGFFLNIFEGEFLYLLVVPSSS